MSPETIKQLRLRLGLSQEKFAHKIGVTMGTIQRWEKGTHKPSELTMEKIKTAKVFNE